MRIILLNDSFPPQIDGVANTVLNYANILTEKGHQVMVMVPFFPDASDRYPYEVVRYSSVDTTRFLGYRTGLPLEENSFERASAFKPDLIHVHCPMVSAILARALRQVTGAPIIFTYHTKFDIELKKFIDAKLLREAVRKILIDNISACDEVWAVSHGAAENLHTLGYTGPVTIMENGVDFPQGGVDVPSDFDAKYHLVPDTPVFLFVGRLAWYKGIRLSLDALAGLQKRGIDFRMLIIGDGNEKPEIVEYAQSLGLSDKVFFLGAIRDRELLRQFFSRADLFLFPSTFDTNGIVVREAAACGLASVLIRESCAAEGIIDRQNGILIEENAQSMETALLEVCSQPEMLPALGKNALTEIYIPWSKSIFHASEQYQKILRRQLDGGYTNIDRRNENFFEFLSSLYDSSVRVKEFFADILEKREEFNEWYKEHISRYL